MSIVPPASTPGRPVASCLVVVGTQVDDGETGNDCWDPAATREISEQQPRADAVHVRGQEGISTARPWGDVQRTRVGNVDGKFEMFEHETLGNEGSVQRRNELANEIGIDGTTTSLKILMMTMTINV